MVFDQQIARERGLEVLRLEAEALDALHRRLSNAEADSLGECFPAACEILLNCGGRVVVTGMGKAGLVGQKISATLASTGTPSLFLHPGEALHGDLGRVRPEDVLLALSKSGDTRELIKLVPAVRALGAQIIALCSSAQTLLGEHADLVLELGEVPEACPLGLAPTVSTTLMLALGDALAMAVQEGRDFTREEFARYHPAGSLGRELMKVAEIMRKGAEIPLVGQDDSLAATLGVMSRTPGRPGAALVVQDVSDPVLLGIFTDGDLRRMAEAGSIPVDDPIRDHMAHAPRTLDREELVGMALRRFRDSHVDQMPVVDAENRVVGLVDVQDLLEVRL